MDLFDKTKLRLDSPATAFGLRDLCRLGVLKSSRYLKALALIKNQQYWDKLLRKFFIFIAVIALLASGIVFFVDNWDNLQFFHKILLTQSFFIISVLGAFFIGYDKIIGRLFLVLAILDIGLMLFIIDARYPRAIDSWVLFMQWLGLIGVWAIIIKSSLVWIFAISLANFTVVLWGYQFGMPNDIITWKMLLSLLCLFNIVMLLFVEIMTKLFLKKQGAYLWITSLTCSFALSLFLAGYQIYEGKFGSFEVMFFIFISAFFSWFYYYKYPKYLAVVIVGSFISVFFIGFFAVMIINFFESNVAGLYSFIGLSIIMISCEIFIIVSLFAWVINTAYKRKEKRLMI